MPINPKFKEPEVDQDDDDYEEHYNAKGRPCPGGMYDASGHLVDFEKFYGYLEHLHDCERERL